MEEERSTAVAEQQDECEDYAVDVTTASSWYKNVSYDDAKIFIRTNIESAARSFIAIGYYLKLIRDGELYREEGHENIWDFAMAEYGISKSTASRYMSMNDRFSLDGNSPIVDQKYKDFGKSKLQEMLYLTDEQLEQVTPEMKVQEIRSMRQPKEIPYFEIEGQLDLEKDFPEVIPEGEGAAPVMTGMPAMTQPVTIQTTMTLDEMMGGEIPEEQQEESEAEEVVAMSQQIEPQDSVTIRRFIKAWSEYCPYDFKRTMRTMRSGKTSGEKARQIQHELAPYNCHGMCGPGYDFTFNGFAGGMDWKVNGERIHIKYERLASELLCMYDPWSPEFNEEMPAADCAADDAQNAAEKQQSGKCLHNPMQLCNLADDDKTTPGTGEDCMHSCCWDCTKHGDCRIECYASERRKYQAEDEEREETLLEPIEFDRDTLEKMIRYAKGTLAAMKEEWIKNQPYTYAKYTMMLQAYEMLLQAHDATDRQPETEVVEQPELPLLKNNDQRAAFIDAYETWPLWIETQETGERYYRYDLPDGTSFVIKTYHSMLYDYKAGIGMRRKEGYGANEQYILEPGKFFRDCSANRSAMIEKLKELQKGER